MRPVNAQSPETPQDRVRTILNSQLAPPLRLMLIAIADYLNTADGNCWPSAETLTQNTGYGERQARELLGELERQGVIRRWWGPNPKKPAKQPIKYIAIEWAVLAAVTAPVETRGGKRAAKIADAPEGDRQRLPESAAKIAETSGKDCQDRVAKIAPEVDHVEATSEATSEATIAGAPDPTKPIGEKDPNRIDPPIADPRSVIASSPVEVLPPRQTSGPPPRLFAHPEVRQPSPPVPTQHAQRSGTAGPPLGFPAADTGAPLPAAAASRKTPDPSKPDPVAETHAVYKRGHPRSTLTDDNRKFIRTLIQRCENPERAQSYLAWVELSMDERAMQLRGDAPWPKGDVKSRDDLYSLGQPHFVAKAMGDVDAWDARGRVNVRPFRQAAAQTSQSQTARRQEVLRQAFDDSLLEVVDAESPFGLLQAASK